MRWLTQRRGRSAEPEEDSRGGVEPDGRPSWWNWRRRETRFVLYVLVAASVAAWRFVPRPWHPTLIVETPRHRIESTATPQQTEATTHALGLLYVAYSNQFGSLDQFEPRHPPLKVKLFKDRAEFRRVNRNLGWAEAFYREPYCRAYFSADEANPFHWMLHESVHQLNREVAHLRLEKWLEEGLATYFSTSCIESNGLAVGRIDPNTYPVWWLDQLATGTNFGESVRNGSAIPLGTIISGKGGPSVNSQFNLYYLHWWTLTHFVFEGCRDRRCGLDLVRQGGTLEAFERLVGPVERVETEWHEHVQRVKTELRHQRLP